MTLSRFQIPKVSGLFARIAEVLRNPVAVPPPSTEFDKLNALTDAELRERGLTRAVLRRHLRQKANARLP